VGDACQPLHGSYLHDGDPARSVPRVVHHRDGSVDTVQDPFGKGVHSVYEDDMINANIDTLMSAARSSVGNAHGMALVQGGQQAGFAVVELMRRTRNAIDPMTLVNAYAAVQNQGSMQAAAALWAQFGAQTEAVIADGCKVLAMIWDSAWAEGNGPAIASNRLRLVAASRLMSLYGDQTFVPSRPLSQIGPLLT
jgi:hypothetical protein